MKVVVAKIDKRKRDGKDTVVFHNQVQMPIEKIETFKRRKVVRESDPASPSAVRPSILPYPREDLYLYNGRNSGSCHLFYASR